MIPKTIHYCWFGNNPKPKTAEKCIKSWRKHCPDYEIIEWNETNFDLTDAPLFIRQAYEAKKWAFVTDYVRLWAVYNCGGLYFDTDIKLLKAPDALLPNTAFFARETGGRVATGLGFGGEKGSEIIKELMQTYESIPFILPDGSYDLTVCGARDTAVFEKNGYKKDEDVIQELSGFVVYPTEYFCTSVWNPKTENTYTVNYYSGSWRDPDEKAEYLRSFRKARRKHYFSMIIHFPNFILLKILGEKRYEKLKSVVKK